MTASMQNVYDFYRLALFGMYISAEVLQYFISVHAASTHAIQTQDSLEKNQSSYKIRSTN